MRDKMLTGSRATRHTSPALKCMSLHKEHLIASQLHGRQIMPESLDSVDKHAWKFGAVLWLRAQFADRSSLFENWTSMELFMYCPAGGNADSSRHRKRL